MNKKLQASRLKDRVQSSDISLFGGVRVEDITHMHEWFIPVHIENEEKIEWCRNCLATRDSNGGIII